MTIGEYVKNKPEGDIVVEKGFTVHKAGRRVYSEIRRGIDGGFYVIGHDYYTVRMVNKETEIKILE